MPDLQYTKTSKEFIIHPTSPKGAEWIARFITTNVTDIRYSNVGIGQARLKEAEKHGLVVTEHHEGDPDPIRERLIELAAGKTLLQLEEIFGIDHDETNNGGVGEIIDILMEQGDSAEWIEEVLSNN